MAKETKEQLMRKAWLRYFNSVLRDQGLITPKEYHAIKLKIETGKNKRHSFCVEIK